MAGYIRQSDYEAALDSFNPESLWDEITKRGQQASQLPGVQGALSGIGGALELAGRPISSIASGVEAARTGNDILGAMGQGLSGQSEIKGFGDVLRNAGVDELGSLDIGPLHVSGRDAIGFGADMLLDPTTYVGGAIGKVIGKAGDAAATTNKLLDTNASKAALGVQQPIPAKPAKYSLPDPTPYDVAEQQLYSGNNPMRVLANLPVVNRVAKYFSPTMVDASTDAEKVKRALTVTVFREEDADRLIATSIADLKANPLPFQLSENKQNFVLPGGREVPTNDLLSDPYRYMPTPEEAAKTHAITYTPEQLGFINRVREIASARRELAKKFGLPEGITKKPEMSSSEWQHVPRRATDKPDYFDVPVYRKSVGKEQPGQMRRGFATQEQGMEEGWVYADPITALEESLKETYSGIIQNETRFAVRPLATVRNESRIKQAQEIVEGLRNIQRGNKLIKELIGRASRGEQIPGATITKLIKDKAQQLDQEDVNLLVQALDARPTDILKYGLQHIDSGSVLPGGSAGNLTRGLIRSSADDSIAMINEFARLNPNLPFSGIVDNLTDYLKQHGRDTAEASRLANQVYKAGVLSMFTDVRNYRKDVLAELSANLAASRKELSESMRSARGTVKAYKEEEDARVAGLLSAQQPAFQGLYFEPEVVAAISKNLKVDPGAWGKVSEFSGRIRKMQASFDLSAPMLQGLPALLTNPGAWAKGFKAQFSALKNPAAIQRYMAENAETINKLPGLIAGAGSNEMFESGNIGLKAIDSIAKRSQAAYDIFGTVTRVEMAKALIPLYEKHGRPLAELADYLNKSTGVISTKAMGISSKQRAVESSLLFFAPRYIRATAALIGDAFLGGNSLEAWQSRQALASMLVAGTATYMKAAEALGQEPILDPADSRFLTVQIENDRVGIGSAWVAILRLIARSTAEPEGLTKWLPKEWGDNPIITWMRSRTSPLTASAADVASGATYGGEKIDSTESFLLYAATRTLPFALENITTPLLAKDISKVTGRPIDSSPSMGPAATGLGLLGLRNFPQNYTERRDSEALTYAREQGLNTKRFAELAPEQQQDVSERMKTKGYNIRGEDALRKNELYTSHNSQLESFASMVANGEITKQQYVEARNNEKASLAAKIEEVNARLDSGKTQAEKDAAFTERINKLAPRDAAREIYYKILFTKDSLGEPSWERAETFLSGLSTEIQDYIEQTGEARLRNLPANAQQIEREYRKARKTLEPYWDVQDKILSKHGLTAKYNALTPAEQAAFQKTDTWRTISKEVREARESLRRRYPEIDKALVEWRGLTPISEQGKSKNLFGNLDFSLPGLNSNPLTGFLD